MRISAPSLAYTVLSSVALPRDRTPMLSSSAQPDLHDAMQPTRRGATALAAILAAAVAMPVVGARAESAKEYPHLRIETTAGIMEFELWDDVAPKHVTSFLKLAKEGFFDHQAFHRIIPGFVIQGGDPQTKLGYGADGTLEGGDRSQIRKWGTGGPGYNVPAEFNSRKHEFGVLSMARSADPNSAGSQFFVCLGTLPSLDNQYTVFGKLTKGEDVLKKLGAAETNGRDVPKVRQGIERADAF